MFFLFQGKIDINARPSIYIHQYELFAGDLLKDTTYDDLANSGSREALAKSPRELPMCKSVSEDITFNTITVLYVY